MRRVFGQFVALAVALVTVLPMAAVCAEEPVLTGRWGDERLPTQLVYESPTKKTSALVVVTFSTKCPLARRLVPRLNELQNQFAAEGVQFVALFPNGADNVRSIAEYAVASGLVFPVFQDDRENPWHEQLELKTTPQVVVLDTREGYKINRVIYRGQVNGRWFGGGTANENKEYLADALAAFIKDEAPPVAETAASGCPISKKTHYDLAPFAGVTYYKEISRLVQDHCLACHRAGEPGAELFAAFDSYDSVAGSSDVMLSRMENRIMPPWHASTDPNNGLGGFKHDNRLTDDQINLFRAWVAAECPAGDAKDEPEPILWKPSDQWQIGTPDFVFEMPEPYVVPKYRLDEYQYYHVKANFPEDRYIQAIELKPGNRSVVHHIGAILGPASVEANTASEAMLKLYGLTGEKVRKLGDYIAGDPFNAWTYPTGYALKLPAGQDIFFEMHYTPTGRDEAPDLSRMGIVWAPVKPEHVVQTRVFNRKDLRLLPNDEHYEKQSWYQFPTDVVIFALAPHMHYRGKDFTLWKVEYPGTPEERRSLILMVSAYDFNWQRTYEFTNPLKLKAGDALYSVTHFDNSHFNPNNPDPEAKVRFGLKSEQEMLNLRTRYEEVDFGKVE